MGCNRYHLKRTNCYSSNLSSSLVSQPAPVLPGQLHIPVVHKVYRMGGRAAAGKGSGGGKTLHKLKNSHSTSYNLGDGHGELRPVTPRQRQQKHQHYRGRRRSISAPSTPRGDLRDPENKPHPPPLPTVNTPFPPSSPKPTESINSPRRNLPLTPNNTLTKLPDARSSDSKSVVTSYRSPDLNADPAMTTASNMPIIKVVPIQGQTQRQTPRKSQPNTPKDASRPSSGSARNAPQKHVYTFEEDQEVAVGMHVPPPPPLESLASMMAEPQPEMTSHDSSIDASLE